MSKIKSYWEDTTTPEELAFITSLPDFPREPDYLPEEDSQEFTTSAPDENDELPF